MAISKKDLKPKVLQALERHGNISRAARELKINRRTIIAWRAKDKVFKAASDMALEIGRE